MERLTGKESLPPKKTNTVNTWLFFLLQIVLILGYGIQDMGFRIDWLNNWMNWMNTISMLT